MKLLFSEHKSDYPNYVFPYAVWAFPEPGETPADLFACGFLPSSRELDRFYLCRHVRVDLRRWRPSSENRRILRKGEGIHFRRVARGDFDYTPARRDFFQTYADIKFGSNVMSAARLDALFAGKITSDLLVFTDERTGAEVGTVTLYCQGTRMAYYYYGFYDLNYYRRNLGLYMMTSAVDFFARQSVEFLYLGSCYSANALYKTQFAGAQFFNGYRWSSDMAELKYLIQREARPVRQHLLETEEYRQQFCDEGLAALAGASEFRATAPGRAGLGA